MQVRQTLPQLPDVRPLLGTLPTVKGHLARARPNLLVDGADDGVDVFEGLENQPVLGTGPSPSPPLGRVYLDAELLNAGSDAVHLPYMQHAEQHPTGPRSIRAPLAKWPITWVTVSCWILRLDWPSFVRRTVLYGLGRDWVCGSIRYTQNKELHKVRHPLEH